MAKAIYPYTTFEVPASPPFPTGQTLLKPVAFATVTASNGESLRLLVLLDTGADACVFPLAVAIALKLDVLSLPSTMTGGVGSNSNVTYYDYVTIDLGQGVSFTAYAGFTEGMNAHGIGLLGQDGFFGRYDVAFSHKKKACVVDIA